MSVLAALNPYPTLSSKGVLTKIKYKAPVAIHKMITGALGWGERLHSQEPPVFRQ